ncbi:intradiol ring-cleavage dioxygenase [Amorphoplanes nipponensis]|uniref:3,4-dioxygenase subunit beta n=1 Tax=Actinoplanes nipponensis TaxID=135950 RepID=A0A919MMV2_9ACTN|nr:intradiol ring-cleavage dioxygenase [Actinoplanes nipponensis]GIE47808.1 3,4-dioxygenase subunit beta [Actinoplanes nipponensis]
MQEQGDQDNAAYVRRVHDKGLRFDLRTMSRRRLLAAFGGAGALALVGGTAACGGTTGTATGDATGTAAATSAAATAAGTEVASETAGPYPADGSNGPDVRTESGIVRKDIRTSFGGASGTAEGVPLEFSLAVTDLDGRAVAGAAVYAWHCDRDGNYSLYSDGVTDRNYLRGIQETDATGAATFTSIFPACYSGRWPHIHFEVYASLADATSGAGPIVKTSQIAIPEDVAEVVYATDGYSRSVTNLSQVTLATDNVFGDDSAATELATVTGSVAAGYVARLAIAIDPSGEETGGGDAPAGGGGPGGAPPSGAPRPASS